MSKEAIEILRGADFVEAQLHSGIRPEDLVVIEREWSTRRQQLHHDLLIQGVERSNWPESIHWNWEKKAPKLSLLAIEGYAISCESAWQATVMVDSVRHSSRLEAGKPILYIDFIEVAPWNWTIKELGQVGEFRGCGSILFRRIVKKSFDEGFNGRVACHALPRAESFYEGFCRMQRFSPDSKKEDLVYFELPAKEAQDLINEGV